ncbi:hypothetical protein CBF34_08110 [Vagococcus penaei]|uniref:Uncharacterized protein n=1 Tax=Vagococcus penaei TaxID=633807 RepID=A0A1Q2D592_9ENTE|nr:hypothetical protein [Vagococcus penaei]AQP53455.1 hypothetical protein BW732_03845 [Vagococcus penaei]RSU00845.1 hypothetical protein CBF34_08110 [Vagococcus penaei]
MKKDLLIAIWGDVVGVKDLLLSIGISVVFTMGGYFLAPIDNRTLQLFFGLLGAVIGFIISTLLVKPKRSITTTSDTGGSLDG